MRINDKQVPATFVQIQNITQKDGSPLEPDNWRNENIGMITLLILAGGIRRQTPFFEIKIWMEDGKIVYLDLDWEGNASTGRDWPREVEPGVYDFESNTSIYRFRLLSEEEQEIVSKAVKIEMMNRRAVFMAAVEAAKNPPVKAEGGFPAS